MRDDVTIPACPGWTVRDLLAHMVDNALGALRQASVAPPEKPTEDASAARLLDTWLRLGEGLHVHLHANDGERGPALLVMDGFTHEVDLRHAVGAPVPAEHVTQRRSLGLPAAGFGESVRLPSVRVVCHGVEWVCGTGAPAVTLAGPRHDVHRAPAGRRSHARIAALDRNGDPAQWLPAFTWGPSTPARPAG
ncbi:maleylpyruvate isomerase family mycothiol-dependent enzyme [Saccharothrix sp. S26]|uniref:maleylpyruvate isomerase family mycothiol-dependent enzyme n=1 Tax=Saccharothrix sp. S26 TaxID=2907215 RepID=UPI001F3DB04C|nr:maleylpyruvate isomerase family mycothiol-dependent enzyme [Saccharothrix sp. S26]MCE6996084.1 maleylpyruvate isomerase family mycothiol-dependent enzyme [Saccharothrix sp. S26]